MNEKEKKVILMEKQSTPLALKGLFGETNYPN
jgi:hypothetical protein